MAIYIGTGSPGSSDFKIEEFQGFPISRCGNYWGSGPVDKDGYLIIEEKPKFKHKSKYHK